MFNPIVFILAIITVLLAITSLIWFGYKLQYPKYIKIYNKFREVTNKWQDIQKLPSVEDIKNMFLFMRLAGTYIFLLSPRLKKDRSTEKYYKEWRKLQIRGMVIIISGVILITGSFMLFLYFYIGN